MYSLNGNPLDAPEFGWKILSATDWNTAINVERPNLVIPGFDGTVPLRGRVETPTLKIVVGGHRSALLRLRALLVGQTFTLTHSLADGASATVQLTEAPSVATPGSKEDDPWSEMTISLLIPGVYLRSSSTDSTTVLDAASKTVNVLPGLSGSVDDSIIRLTDCTNPEVRDAASNTWVRYTGVIESGQYLRINTRLGRAWRTNSDTWSGGTEVEIQSGVGPYYLRIQPTLTASSTTGKLTVTTSARGENAAITVRAQNAYNL